MLGLTFNPGLELTGFPRTLQRLHWRIDSRKALTITKLNDKKQEIRAETVNDWRSKNVNKGRILPRNIIRHFSWITFHSSYQFYKAKNGRISFNEL